MSSNSETEAITQEPEFWDCEESEILTWTDPNEAIEAFLDNIDPKQWPEEVEVTGYARMQPKVGGRADRVLEQLLEELDEGYGNPDGPMDKPTETMREAAEKFVSTVVTEFQSWACMPVTSRTVNVREWVTRFQPAWLEELDDFTEEGEHDAPRQ